MRIPNSASLLGKGRLFGGRRIDQNDYLCDIII